MLLSRIKSQAAAAVGAILLGGQAAQAIDLDLSSSGQYLAALGGALEEPLAHIGLT